MTLLSAIGGSVLLSLYYIIGYLAISNPENYLDHNHTPYNPKRILFCILLYISGVALMLHADNYKFKKLSIHKKVEESKNQNRIDKTNGLLITTNVFKYTRNPNYLGEAILYSSFAILSNSIISYAILLFVFSTVFLVNMLCKELSFQKKPNWNSYKE